MAKTYFSQYIDDIDKIIKEAVNKHDMASIALAKAAGFDRSVILTMDGFVDCPL